MHTFIRYLLFQIPQWLALALFLWFLVDMTTVPRWASIGFFIFWVVKDFALYPFVRLAYENNAKNGTEQLIGGKGVTRETLAPEGYIRIQGELWKAFAKSPPIPQDSTVKVTGAKGMILIVEPENGPDRQRWETGDRDRAGTEIDRRIANCGFRIANFKSEVSSEVVSSSSFLICDVLPDL